MIELGRLYQEVAELVHQQEPAVEQINQGANEVVENVNNANQHLNNAIKSARKARKWKWITLLVVRKYLLTPPCMGRMLTLSVAIIGIVVGVAVGVSVNKK